MIFLHDYLLFKSQIAPLSLFDLNHVKQKKFLEK